MIGVARSLVSGGQRFPEGPTHMLPLLMRALPGVDPNDFSKCMVRSRYTFIVTCRLVWLQMSYPSSPVSTDHIPVHCNVCDSCAFGGLFVHPPRKNGSDRGETRVLLWTDRGPWYQEFTNNYIPCVLGWERDVLGIGWVWRFCAAVYGQVPVCSHLSLLAIFGEYTCRDICQFASMMWGRLLIPLIYIDSLLFTVYTPFLYSK